MIENDKYYNIDKLLSYNNPSFIEKMIQLFVKSANDYSINVTIAINEKDLMKVSQLAHCIKPSIDLLNISSLIIIIREIENASEYNSDLMRKIIFSIEQLAVVIKQMSSDFE